MLLGPAKTKGPGDYVSQEPDFSTATNYHFPNYLFSCFELPPLGNKPGFTVAAVHVATVIAAAAINTTCPSTLKANTV